MATDLGRAYREWPQLDELSNQNDCQEPSTSQLLDHGSISFGRFAEESLCWEKWSVFSHNRCKEELEKFRAPGLVAQKKAYFEEYYRRIRALKALQSQQDGLTMDSGDSIVCSQGPEDEQSTAKAENCIDGQDDVFQMEEDTVQVFAEQDKVPTDIPQTQHLEPHTKVSCTDYPKTSKEGTNEEIENLTCNNLLEKKVIVGFNSERIPEGQPKKYVGLDDERIEIEDTPSGATLQYETPVEDVLHGGSGIKQEINLVLAKIEVNHKINESPASVAKKSWTSVGEPLQEVVRLGRSLKSVKQNVTQKESSAITIRNSVKGDLKKGNMPKSLIGFKYSLCKVPGKEESRMKLSKIPVNNAKESAPSFSHKPLKYDASVTSVERNAKVQTRRSQEAMLIVSCNMSKDASVTSVESNAKVQTRRSQDATKSARCLKHPLPKATNRTNDAINSRLGSSNAHSTLNKLKHPVPETTRRTKDAINSCGGASNAYSTMNKSTSVSENRQSRGVSSFSSCRSSKEASSVSSQRPSEETLSSVRFPKTLSLSGERRTVNKGGAQSSCHSGLSNKLLRSSVDAKSLSLGKHMSAGKAFSCGVRDTASGNRRSVNLPQTKSNMSHPMKLQLGRNDRNNKQKEETGAAEFRELRISSKFAPSPKQTS
ncbi:uncharacterized protein [Aristolochia californica]|uniref:uncharacterized protein n=1 Tax=Aristolochia californica TaxID=171875 RepID=UPI0035D70EAE